MKDTDKVELTVGNIKAAAGKCGTVKEVLKELFPEVFRESPPEWKDVTRACEIKEYSVYGGSGEGSIGVGVPMHDGDAPFFCPLVVVYNKNWGGKGFTKEGYPIDSDGVVIKISGGKIWRRKSE